MKILALDLGKFNTMCCFFDAKTRKAESAGGRELATTAKPPCSPAPLQPLVRLHWVVELVSRYCTHV